MEENKRKAIILTFIGALTLLFVVVGGTFAYFQIVNTDKGETNTNFETATDDLNKYGTPLLTKKSDLYINLTSKEMSYSNGGNSYWATKVTEPQDIKFETGRKNHVISTASIERPEGEDVVEDAYLSCTSELTITIDGEMKDVLETGDGTLYLGTSASGKNKGSITPESFDLAQLISEQGEEGKKVTVNYTIVGYTSVDVTADVEIINKADKPQNLLAGTKITITITNNNLSCSVSEKTITPLELVSSNPQGLSQDPVGGMHRYQGLYTDDIKNYICLGDNCCTTESCPASDSDDMYRIIGITDSGEMKVIKKTALTDEVKWWSDNKTDIKWPESLIYQKLNGKSEGSTEPNLNDENSYYYSLDDNLKNLIVKNHSWLYGDTVPNDANNPYDYSGDTIYGIESGSSEATYYQEGDSSGSPTGKGEWNERIEAPIGLMYISDYLYAYKTSADDAGKPGSSTNAANSWIAIRRNQSNYIGEWTMSRWSFSSAANGYYAWYVLFNGSVKSNSVVNREGVRPTFYLSSDVELTGEGSLTNPFTVKALVPDSFE